MLELSIVIVTYNSDKYISSCLDSIAKELQDIRHEVIVVDNCSKDATTTILKKRQNVIVINNPQNEGFATANNRGIKAAKGKYVLILNPDIVLTAQTKLKEIFAYIEEHSETALVAARLFYEDGSVQESARSFPYVSTFLIRGFKLDKYFKNASFYKRKSAFQYVSSTEPVEVDWVIGAFMVIPKNVLESVGSFDRKFFMYYEDADLCRRIKQRGYKIVYYPMASAIHVYCRESAKSLFSRLKFIHVKSFLRFLIRRQLNVS